MSTEEVLIPSVCLVLPFPSHPRSIQYSRARSLLFTSTCDFSSTVNARCLFNLAPPPSSLTLHPHSFLTQFIKGHKLRMGVKKGRFGWIQKDISHLLLLLSFISLIYCHIVVYLIRSSFYLSFSSPLLLFMDRKSKLERFIQFVAFSPLPFILMPLHILLSFSIVLIPYDPCLISSITAFRFKINNCRILFEYDNECLICRKGGKGEVIECLIPN